ncbi:MAG: lipoyl protein ligase domain-containing protein [Acidobacteriota bacterium]
MSFRGRHSFISSKNWLFSFCSGEGCPFRERPPSYLISEALMEGLRRLGLNPNMTSSHPDNYSRGNLPCFSFPARNEVEINGKKIIGSAQKRVENRFIQPGSIPLRNTSSLLKDITFLKQGTGQVRMISLEEALDVVVEFDEVVASLVRGFSDYFQIDFLPNIIIDRDGNVRIMDFWIARSLKTKGITDKSVMIGTPEYMSPEQVEGYMRILCYLYLERQQKLTGLTFNPKNKFR